MRDEDCKLRESLHKEFKCVKCESKLRSTYPSFTGVSNYNEGQYIRFYYCENLLCERYSMYVNHTLSEIKK